jgi:hypothetical protein
VYRAVSKSVLNQRLLFTFNATSQMLKSLDHKFIWERRKNLTGLHLKVSFLENNPVIVRKNEVKPLDISKLTTLILF